MEVYPQVLMNVRVSNKQKLSSNSAIDRAIERAEALISKEGTNICASFGNRALGSHLGRGSGGVCGKNCCI